jgi:hypothetical protein
MKTYLSFAAAASSTLLVFAGGTGAVRAQATLPPPAAAAAAAQDASAPRSGTRPLADVLARLSRGAGVAVVAESALAGRVPLPAAPSTPENVEQQLVEIVRALPEGTIWRKLYLPQLEGRALRGDDVAEYAAAQAKLFGTRDNVPAGTVEVLGQRLAAAEAADVIARLKLRPVYLISNPSRPPATAAGVGFVNVGVDEWMRMTPAQREAAAQQQAANLMAADPGVRQQMLMQQAMVIRSMLQNMTPDQRQQMFRGMQQFFQGLPGPGQGPQ